MNKYEKFLLHNQVGAGLGPYYRSTLQVQRGRGLGSIFSSIYAALKPWIVSGSKALGHEVLRSGHEVLQNLGNGGAGGDKTIDVLLKEQGIKSLQNLTQKATNALSGRGIKRKRQAASSISCVRAKQVKRTPRRKKTAKKKKPKKKKKKVQKNKKTVSKKKKKTQKTAKTAQRKRKPKANKNLISELFG